MKNQTLKKPIRVHPFFAVNTPPSNDSFVTDKELTHVLQELENAIEAIRTIQAKPAVH